MTNLIATILARDTSGLSERVDESAVGRAAAIQQITNAVDTYGVETVGKWLRNIAHGHGYTVTVQGPEPPSPGTLTDPRR